jgi:hypothetical protein
LAAASEDKKRRELIAEAENYAADLEASRIRKIYAAYRESIQEMRQSLGLDGHSDPYLFDFLNQQKWATAYEKNQQGQNTFVLNNSGSAPGITLPPLAAGQSPSEQSSNRSVTTFTPQLQSKDANVADSQNPIPGLRQPVRETNRSN